MQKAKHLLLLLLIVFYNN